MDANGSLAVTGAFLDTTFRNNYIINGSLGLLSSIIDNVPLVAGAMGMYSMELYPQDHVFWTLLAYCAGTGGSVLIIGSAAGIAAMGILKIDFIWYLRHVSWLALVGYLAGIAVYALMNI
jgi:Na+/H+ antiporter NhaD/arsenite permease-like protein